MCSYDEHTIHVYFRYIKDQGEQRLKDCRRRVAEHQDGIQQILGEVEKMRAEVETLGTEVSSASTTLSNLKDNIRLRKISNDIAATAAELEGLNLDEASRAREQFDEKYPRAKASEEEATRQVSRKTFTLEFTFSLSRYLCSRSIFKENCPAYERN